MKVHVVQHSSEDSISNGEIRSAVPLRFAYLTVWPEQSSVVQTCLAKMVRRSPSGHWRQCRSDRRTKNWNKEDFLKYHLGLYNFCVIPVIHYIDTSTSFHLRLFDDPGASRKDDREEFASVHSGNFSPIEGGKAFQQPSGGRGFPQ